MTIADIGYRGKELLGRIPPHALTFTILILATMAAFGLGVLAGRDLERAHAGSTSPDTGFWIENRAIEAAGPAASIESLPEPSSAHPDAVGSYVASKNGTKFYLPSCSGAARIKEENKIWFSSRQDAVDAGYQPASTCKGL